MSSAQDRAMWRPGNAAVVSTAALELALTGATSISSSRWARQGRQPAAAADRPLIHQLYVPASFSAREPLRGARCQLRCRHRQGRAGTARTVRRIADVVIQYIVNALAASVDPDGFTRRWRPLCQQYADPRNSQAVPFAVVVQWTGALRALRRLRQNTTAAMCRLERPRLHR